jgi:hydrogenase expression/formation protein HypC
MCLAIPGRIVEIEQESGVIRSGKVDFDGILKNVNLSYVPKAKVGDYVIVHVGFALNVLDEKDALESISLMKEITEQNETSL